MYEVYFLTGSPEPVCCIQERATTPVYAIGRPVINVLEFDAAGSSTSHQSFKLYLIREVKALLCS